MGKRNQSGGDRFATNGNFFYKQVNAPIKATKDNYADFYWGREKRKEFLDLVQRYEEGDINLPWHPREVSLYRFAAHFEKNWSPATRTYVPHISPVFRYLLCVRIYLVCFENKVGSRG